MPLLPDTKVIVSKVPSDGNCFYAAVSVILSGTVDYHGFVRRAVTSFVCNEEVIIMRGDGTAENKLQRNEKSLQSRLLPGESGKQHMEQVCPFAKCPRKELGTLVDTAIILATAQMFGMDIIVLDPMSNHWFRHAANFPNSEDQTDHAMFLQYSNYNHHEPVLGVRRNLKWKKNN